MAEETLENKKKLLIIEDDWDTLVMMRDYMVRAGFEVVSAQDGEDGLSKAFSEKPDLILLDIMLPKKSGIEVLRELRKNRSTRSIRVIIVSIRAEDRELKKEFGKTPAMAKPFEPQRLLEAVQRSLSK